MKNKLANEFQAKWRWAQERFGFVHVTDAEQKQIIEELHKLEEKNLKLKKLILKERKERDA